MNRRHDDSLPSRRIARWVSCYQAQLAWSVLALISALLTTIAWRVMYA